MPQITLKETITKKIEIPMDTLYEIIDKLTDKERKDLMKRLESKSIELKPFKKDEIDSIIADFSSTELYEEGFLKDLEEGLKRSSVNI